MNRERNLEKNNKKNLTLFSCLGDKDAKKDNKNKKEIFIILDSDALLYRSYYALPALTTDKGELVNAVYGFLLIFLKVVKEFNPDYIAAAFDFPAPTFRHQRFKDYKSQREKTPDDLRAQFPLIKEILKAFRVPIFEVKGFEADDIIGTLARKITEENQKIEIMIVSGDKDIISLVNKQIKVYFLKKGVKSAVFYDEEKVKEEYHLTPDQLIDFKALRGDPSDNIPGVPGIGEKTAIDLIKKFNSLEELYKAIENKNNLEIKSSLKENLLKHKKEAIVSKELVMINCQVPVSFKIKDCYWKNYKKEEVIDIFQKYGFKTLISRLNKLNCAV